MVRGALSRSFVALRGIFILSMICIISAPVEGDKFVEFKLHETGYHEYLKYYEVLSTFTNSSIICGSICEKMVS